MIKLIVAPVAQILVEKSSLDDLLPLNTIIQFNIILVVIC